MKKINDNKKIEEVFSASGIRELMESINDRIQFIIHEQHDEIISCFDKMDGCLDKLQDDVTEIKYKLSEKVDTRDFKKLEKRLIKLEKMVLA